MKKFISAVIAIGLCISVFAIPTFADSNIDSTDMEDTVQPCHTYINSAYSTISVSGRDILCDSNAIATSSVVKMKAVQTIEKHWGLGIFIAMDGVQWTKEVNVNMITMNNRKPDMASGTYRFVTDFTATNSDGSTETVTVYSSEVTIP